MRTLLSLTHTTDSAESIDTSGHSGKDASSSVEELLVGGFHNTQKFNLTLFKNEVAGG